MFVQSQNVDSDTDSSSFFLFFYTAVVLTFVLLLNLFIHLTTQYLSFPSPSLLRMGKPSLGINPHLTHTPPRQPTHTTYPVAA